MSDADVSYPGVWGTWVCSTARSRSSRARGAASAARRRCCSPPRARRSSSTTSAARPTARAPTPRPAQQVVDEIVAAGGKAVANYDERRRLGGRARASIDQAVDDVRRPRRPRQQRRHPPRQDELQHGRGRVGLGHRRPPQGPLLRRRSSPPRTGARKSEGDRRAGRTRRSSTPRPSRASTATPAR